MPKITEVVQGCLLVAGDDEHGLVVIAIGDAEPVGIDTDAAREMAEMLVREADLVDAKKAERKAKAH